MTIYKSLDDILSFISLVLLMTAYYSVNKYVYYFIVMYLNNISITLFIYETIIIIATMMVSKSVNDIRKQNDHLYA